MPKIIMLEGTHIPLVAECRMLGWNDFHVPFLTLDAFNAYLAACKVNDPNGEWDERAYVQGDTLRFPFWEAPEDRDEDMVFESVGADDQGRALYPIDGFVWVDFEEED